MSSWYLFSALGFYPVDPASATYVLGAPFFDRIELRLPSAYVGAAGLGEGTARAITVVAPGASRGKRFVHGVRIDGRSHAEIEITHEMISGGASIEFEMRETPQAWPAK